MMSGISKESFLKAEDAKNRDAMLYDMLMGLHDKLDDCGKLKNDVEGVKRQVSYIKGIGVSISAAFTAVLTWLQIG